MLLLRRQKSQVLGTMPMVEKLKYVNLIMEVEPQIKTGGPTTEQKWSTSKETQNKWVANRNPTIIVLPIGRL